DIQAIGQAEKVDEKTSEGNEKRKAILQSIGLRKPPEFKFRKDSMENEEIEVMGDDNGQRDKPDQRIRHSQESVTSDKSVKTISERTIEDMMEQIGKTLVDIQLNKAEMMAAQRTVMELVQNMQIQIIDTNAAVYKMQRKFEEAGNQKQQMEEQTKEVIQRQEALQQDILTIGQQNQKISQQMGTVLGWIEETKGKLDGVTSKTEEIVERITGSRQENRP
ncbi:hypothetical protein RFI_32002, partial [Reticulomyxa filosa]